MRCGAYDDDFISNIIIASDDSTSNLETSGSCHGIPFIKEVWIDGIILVS
jgi:hypothetical protein